MLLAVGVIYLILGAQFKSYVQPLIHFPRTAAGLHRTWVFGLYLTDNPLSLYTMYGMVALTGVIISTAIVLIDAANTRRNAGSDPLQGHHFCLDPAPVADHTRTSTTTFVDLVPLACWLGRQVADLEPDGDGDCLWVAVSTVLTLFVVPLLYFLIELAKPQRATATARRLPDKVKI